jgi:hypothetical protein
MGLGILLVAVCKPRQHATFFALAMLLVISQHADNARGSGMDGGSHGAGTRVQEDGLGSENTLLYSATIHGDFVASGSSTRGYNHLGDPQPDPVLIQISGIPPGAVIEKAFANWSYLTNSPGHPDEAQISINGTSVEGTLTGTATEDLCWNHPVEHNYTVAYTADITGIVNAAGGNATYAISEALDEPASDGLGEGISLVVVFTHPEEALRLINVWSGMVTTQTGTVFCVAHADLEFRNDAQVNVPFIGGPAHFFLNALDGQWADDAFYDTFRLNSIVADGFPGTVPPVYPAANAWQGLLGINVKNNVYDEAEGDASAFMSHDHTVLEVETDNRYGVCWDCIGHSLAAIAFVSEQ